MNREVTAENFVAEPHKTLANLELEVTAKKTLAQPHNCYNIFFILERQMLIHAMKGSSDGDGTP
eukprot:CAMPEP_0181084954 /NCGR_PEP_ID=MMETSP1071-20121207/4969_1 /TAXON_ID=35127 /ORGANISM="Thalassiosira sp., Strain NH16" /LENGTH=63 /DNA_ID=CAMNT_0023166719 /DNA_START=159 /DNA_END=347 /DNA_ORIENTATION=-